MDVFEGEPPTTWCEVTTQPGPLTDEGACAVAAVACLVSGFVNRSARETLDAVSEEANAA